MSQEQNITVRIHNNSLKFSSEATIFRMYSVLHPELKYPAVNYTTLGRMTLVVSIKLNFKAYNLLFKNDLHSLGVVPTLEIYLSPCILGERLQTTSLTKLKKTQVISKTFCLELHF